MKTRRVIRIVWLLSLMLCCGWETVMAQGRELVVSGVVRDKESRQRIENAAVSLVGTNIGTVTNADGAFQLKLPREKLDGGLEISYLGYLNSHISAEVLCNNRQSMTVWMIPATTRLEELLVYGGPARQLVEEALSRIPMNYPKNANMLNMFYRETIRKGHRYVAISEAIMNVQKSDYGCREVDHDRVQLLKGRRLLNQKAEDTLAVKIQGGPNLPIMLDVVKNPDALFNEESLDYFTFTQEVPVMMDNCVHFVVSFTPGIRLDYALFSGKLYIDSKTMTLTRAEYSLDMSDRAKATAAMLYKKPSGLIFIPYEVSYIVAYRRQGELSVLNYVCSTFRFKCNWKRRLFSSAYTARSEMVMVDREEHPVGSIRSRDAFGQRQIFNDVVDAYWNEDFWKDYNILEPTESLESAVRKLRKK